MRLPISLLYAIFVPSVLGVGKEVILDSTAKDVEVSDDTAKPSIFNGLEVPILPEINGDNLDGTIQRGYWLVKYYSPFCIHCQHIAPAWQTLYEFYYTSKPPPAGAPSNTSPDSMNSFKAYYDFHFGSLNCVAFGTACSNHKVSSFPAFILYQDGKEIKRFDGPRDMKGLSVFVEETLEAIRPGSRPLNGPALPEPEATTSPDHVDFKTDEMPLQKQSQLSAAPEKPGNKAKDPTKAEAQVLKDIAEKKEKDDKNAQIKQEAKDKAEEEERRLAAGSKIAYMRQSSKSGSLPNPAGLVFALDAETFMSAITASRDLWLVKFFAPWCHHCQAMAPNWLQLAKEMKGKLNVGEVDCVANARLCKDVDARSFPTIMLFKGGQRIEYQGLRGLGDFVKFAENAVDIGGEIKDITASEFKEMEETEEVIFLYFYDHATTTEDFKSLEKLTLNLVGHGRLVKTDSALLADRFKITTWPRLIVSRSGRPTYYTPLAPYELRDYGAVLRWMESVWMPLVPEMTVYNAREIMDGKIAVLGILSHERPDEFMMAKNELKTAALEWMDKQTQQFQLERQELRDAKQLRIEEAEDRNDQRALRSAKTIVINMNRSDRKEVAFAWVDGIFWERWIRTTYGIEVKNQGEKIIINDEDNRQYWDQTVTGNYITPSRTAILDTIPKVIKGELKAKSTISRMSKFFFRLKNLLTGHPILCVLVVVAASIAAVVIGRARRRRGGHLRLDEEDSCPVGKGGMGMGTSGLGGMGAWLSGNGRGASGGKVD